MSPAHADSTDDRFARRPYRPLSTRAFVPIGVIPNPANQRFVSQTDPRTHSRYPLRSRGMRMQASREAQFVFARGVIRRYRRSARPSALRGLLAQTVPPPRARSLTVAVARAPVARDRVRTAGRSRQDRRRRSLLQSRSRGSLGDRYRDARDFRSRTEAATLRSRRLESRAEPSGRSPSCAPRVASRHRFGDRALIPRPIRSVATPHGWIVAEAFTSRLRREQVKAIVGGMQGFSASQVRLRRRRVLARAPKAGLGAAGLAATGVTRGGSSHEVGRLRNHRSTESQRRRS